MLTELRVPIAVWVLLEILQVKQLKRHAGTAQLTVQVGAVRLRPITALRGATVELKLELGFVEPRSFGPTQPGILQTAQRLVDAAHADAETASHLPVAATQLELLT
jgi:hypothetical protein